jgi:hypothetical protein
MLSDKMPFIIEDLCPKVVIGFMLEDEYHEAKQFCLSYGLDIFCIDFLGLKSIFFFDIIESLIFAGFANDRFWMTYYWY